MKLHGCTLFPKPAEVFADKVAEHRAVLLPFLVMPLDLIVPGSDIRVPWVIPHEPYEGCVGQVTKKYHSFFSRENWIGFHLKAGKLRFDSDLSFFIKHQFDHLPSARRSFKHHEGADQECNESHQEIEQRYEACRKRFGKDPVSLMESYFVQNTKHKGVGIFYQLGGRPGSGNWASTQKKTYFAESSDYPAPIDRKGQKLIYMGSVRPRINHANEVLGFINEDLDHVVFTFDFS